MLKLNRGESNVFTPITVTPGPFSPFPVRYFLWHQPDYFEITNALYQFVWKRSSEDRVLYHVYFNRGCQDNPSGFDEGEITYFKTIEINGEKEYTARGIRYISSVRRSELGQEEQIFPVHYCLGEEVLILGKSTVTADDALSIAEKNGGESARLRSQKQLQNILSSHLRLKVGLLNMMDMIIRQSIRYWLVYFKGLSSRQVSNLLAQDKKDSAHLRASYFRLTVFCQKMSMF